MGTWFGGGWWKISRVLPATGDRAGSRLTQLTRRASACAGPSGSGGDGENRTRVRKIRPQASTSLASLFLRHRLGPTRQGHRPIIRCVLGPSHGNSISIPAFVSLMARAVRRGSRSTGLPTETALSHSTSLRREGESAVVCAVGTYCFCAALTRTAPLGLQLVTSFLRRSLSSPDNWSIAQKGSEHN